MGNFALWLSSMVPSLVGRVMLSLGLGVLTITGIDVAWGSLRGSLLQALAGLPVDVLGLAGLAGVGDALGYVLGAITARVTLAALTNSARIVGAST
jgi:hypothetical protein